MSIRPGSHPRSHWERGLGCPIARRLPYALDLGLVREVRLTCVWPWLCRVSGITNPLSPT